MEDNDGVLTAGRAINDNEREDGDQSPFSADMEREVSRVVLGDRRHGIWCCAGELGHRQVDDAKRAALDVTREPLR